MRDEKREAGAPSRIPGLHPACMPLPYDDMRVFFWTLHHPTRSLRPHYVSNVFRLWLSHAGTTAQVTSEGALRC